MNHIFMACILLASTRLLVPCLKDPDNCFCKYLIWKEGREGASFEFTCSILCSLCWASFEFSCLLVKISGAECHHQCCPWHWGHSQAPGALASMSRWVTPTVPDCFHTASSGVERMACAPPWATHFTWDWNNFLSDLNHVVQKETESTSKRGFGGDFEGRIIFKGVFSH